jgi:hypothetical protein
MDDDDEGVVTTEPNTCKRIATWLFWIVVAVAIATALSNRG